jgi:hypothetical protein
MIVYACSFGLALFFLGGYETWHWRWAGTASLVALFTPVALLLAYKLAMFFFSLFVGIMSAFGKPDFLRSWLVAGELPDEPALAYSEAVVDQDQVGAAMRELAARCGGAVPRWVSEGVNDLALPAGLERQQKRAAFLDRLYRQAGFSSDDYATRHAYNQLRTAINPYAVD